MDFSRLSLKYTDFRVEDDALIAAHQRGGIDALIAQAVERAADAVRHVDKELAFLSAQIFNSISAVDENLHAAPGQQVRTLNPLGELQANGPRFDALIAMRADRIEQLRQLVHLWRQLPAHISTPDGP